MRAALLAAFLALPAGAQAAFWSRGDQLTRPKEHFEAGRYAQVVESLRPEALQKLAAKDLRAAYLYLGTSQERLGRVPEAVGVYQLGVRLFPKDINLLSSLAALLHRSGLEEQAEPLYEKVLKLHPNNAAAHLGLAGIDRALGLLETSASHYEKALEELGGSAEVWRGYAEVLLDQRDFRTAELAIRRALEISEDADPMLTFALIQRGSGRLPEALATLDRARALAPARVDLDLARALWLLEAGRYDAASAAAEALLKSDPESPVARWVRARAHLKADRYNQAVADLAVAARGETRAPFAAKAAATLLAELQGRKK